jgi:hypothetical protein
MHIHSNQLILNTVNPYSAAAEKALAAERGGKVRKKLLKSSADVEAISNPEEGSKLDLWMNSGHGATQGDLGYDTAGSGSD